MIHQRSHHNSQSSVVMPLSLVSSGTTTVIREIRGGQKMRQRLIDLGLNQGASIQVVKNEARGPLIVAVKTDGRLALGRGMAHRIFVDAGN